MHYRVQILLAFVIAFTVSGCSARQVYRDADSGVIALPANTDMWPFRFRSQASRMMSEQFPDGYVVVSEGEEVIGQTTTYDEQADGIELLDGLIQFNGGNRSGTATTTDETEYRIRYRRQ